MAGARSRRRRGQALVMATLGLIAMFGLIGLAVDFGWAFFVKKAAQSAADAAALAAVTTVWKNATGPADFACTGPLAQCYAAPTPCPATGALPLNLQGACIYAANNGFSRANPRQNVTVQASDSDTPPTVKGCSPVVSSPPTAPCVNAYYWVTVRVSESVPQLFSAVLGNGNALVAARATAAIAKTEVIGALILLNRQNDTSPQTSQNLILGGTPSVTVPGGIVLASNSASAGAIQGGGTVLAPFTYVRPGGGVTLGGSGTWTAPPSNQPDGSMFYDPMQDDVRLFGQPPVNSKQASLAYIAVPGGVLSTAQCPSGVCPPGNYYATTVTNGQTVASGARIVVPMNSTFSFAGGNFGDFVFFGGLYVNAATVNFGPGRYVMAGVNGANLNVFETSNQAFVSGGTNSTSDAGRIFILTDGSYGGQLDAALNAIPNKQFTSLQFGAAAFQSGNNSKSQFMVWGLNPTSADLPQELQHYGPLVVWQDQRNSNVKYTATGAIDTTSCGTPSATLDSPCMNLNDPARGLILTANQRTQFGGVVYQPRGSWVTIQAAPGYSGPLRIVTGTISLQGSGSLNVTSPTFPITNLTVSLVE